MCPKEGIVRAQDGCFFNLKVVECATGRGVVGYQRIELKLHPYPVIWIIRILC